MHWRINKLTALLILRQIGGGLIHIDAEIAILLVVAGEFMLVCKPDSHWAFRTLLAGFGDRLVDDPYPCMKLQRGVLRNIKIEQLGDRDGKRLALTTLAAELPNIGDRRTLI